MTESERYGLYFDEKHPEKHHYEAVYATGGMVAHFNKQPVVLFTSEICGGMTATPDMVWHDVHPQPYYQIVICEYCLGSKPFEWTNAIRSEALGEALFDHRDAVSVWISQYYENGRPKFITAQMNRQKKTFTVEEFRHRLAVQYESRIILSDWFEISDLNFFPETNAGPHSIRISQTIVSSEPDIVYFKGWGKGHGIGICQEASRRQARSGKNTSEILHYYYPRVNTRMIDSEE